MKSRLYRGLILIIMMFGHNYVLNQAQSLQKNIQQLHELTVPQFNLLYSVPSAISIVFIIPLGILYDRYSQKILIFAALSLLIGQIFVTFFGPKFIEHSFLGLLTGRVLQGVGAEVLYMIQGNLASTWMGNAAGMIFILPEVGEIFNVIITPLVTEKYGIFPALILGLSTCVLSFFSCLLLYNYFRKIYQNKMEHPEDEVKQLYKIQHIDTEQQQGKQQQSAQQLKEISPDNGNNEESQQVSELSSILKAGRAFWLILIVCTINECLYFPFLDNANVLIQTRFCVPNQKTGMYLCLPFISAITTTFLLGKFVLGKVARHLLIFLASIVPLVGHTIIYIDHNCQSEIALSEKIMLILGLIFFGMGLGSYYSISFPAVGLSVPESIRGTAYSCLCLFQTISMTLIPEISGFIIEKDEINNDNFTAGYKNSSLFFVFLCALGVFFSLLVFLLSNQSSFAYNDYENEKNIEKQERNTNIMTDNREIRMESQLTENKQAD